jgi:hypothetical protein
VQIEAMANLQAVLVIPISSIQIVLAVETDGQQFNEYSPFTRKYRTRLLSSFACLLACLRACLLFVALHPHCTLLYSAYIKLVTRLDSHCASPWSGKRTRKRKVNGKEEDTGKRKGLVVA